MSPIDINVVHAKLKAGTSITPTEAAAYRIYHVNIAREHAARRLDEMATQLRRDSVIDGRLIQTSLAPPALVEAAKQWAWAYHHGGREDLAGAEKLLLDQIAEIPQT